MRGGRGGAGVVLSCTFTCTCRDTKEGWSGKGKEKNPITITSTSTKKASGFILLETLVAMVVLSIGVLAVNRALEDALVARAQARDYTQARFMLEQLIAEIDMRPELAEGTETGNFGAAHPRFRWERRVVLVQIPTPRLPGTVPEETRQVFVPPVSRLVKLTAVVRWTRAGRDFQETAETLVSDTRLKKEGDT